jgi:uncharacterized tellurite resistance protein B-like protein
MSLISRLRDLFELLPAAEPSRPEADARLTVAALLVLVARVDGRVVEAEETGLHALLRSRFSLSDEQVRAVIAQTDAMAGFDQAATLSDRILQEIGEGERPEVMALAYRIAALDGVLHEFEEDLLWRIGRLLGFSDAEAAAIRDGALANLAPGRNRVP